MTDDDRREHIRNLFDSSAENEQSEESGEPPLKPIHPSPYVTGNGNNVGDNNTIIHRSDDRRPPPQHPNATQCPQCHERTWAASDRCVVCGFSLAEYYEAQAIQAAQHRDHISKCGSSGVLMLFIAVLLTVVRPTSLFAPLSTFMTGIAVIAGVAGAVFLGLFWHALNQSR